MSRFGMRCWLYATACMITLLLCLSESVCAQGKESPPLDKLGAALSKVEGPENLLKPVIIDPLRVSTLTPEGSFDTMANGCPQNWEVSKASDETGLCGSDTKAFRSGKASLVISRISECLMLVRDPIPIDPKISYVVFAWLKCEKLYQARGVIEVSLLNSKGCPVGPTLSDGVSADSEFVQKRIEVRAEQIPPDAVAMQIRLGVRGKTTGSVWFDDLAVIPRQATISLTSGKPSNLFHIKEPIVFTARIHSCLLTDENCELKVALKDFWGKEYPVLRENRQMLSRTPLTKLIPIEPHGLGHFRLTATLLAKWGGMEENSVDMAVVSPFSDAIWALDSPFGSHSQGASPVPTGSKAMPPGWNGASPDKLIRLMREAYVKWARTGARWASVERKPGQYDFAGLEKAFKPFLDNGMQLLPIISDTPEWISSYKEGMPRFNPQQGDGPGLERGMPTGFQGSTYGAYPPRDYKPLSDFCERLGAQFQGRIKYWEIWNEPNCSFWKGTRQDFAKFLAASYSGLHKGDPACQVIFEASGIDLSFWDEVCRSGGNGFFDVLATHNYQLTHTGPPEASPYLAGYYGMRQFLTERNEWGKPIWDTEFCWMSKSPQNRPGWKGVGERDQANYLVRSWTLALSAGVERMFWFPFYSYGGGELNEPHPGGLVREDYSIKPAFVAHRVMAECLAGATYSRSIDVGAGARCYVFKKADSEVAVTWSTERPGRVWLASSAPLAHGVDIMGNAFPITVQDGILAVPVDVSPCFVVSKRRFDPALGAVSDEMFVKLIETRPPTKSPADTSAEMAVTVTNRKNEDLRAWLRFNPPTSWPPPEPARKIKVKKGETKTFLFSYNVPGSNALYGHLTVEVISHKSFLRLERKVPLLAQVVAGPTPIGKLADWSADDCRSVLSADEAGVQPLHGVSAACDDAALYVALSAAKSLKPESAEFLVDLANDGRFDASAGDFWAHVNFRSGAVKVMQLHLLTRRPAKEVEGATAFVSETPNMFVSRIRLPYSCLGEVRPDPGNAVGLGVIFHNGTGEPRSNRQQSDGPRLERGEPVAWPPTFRKNAKTAGQIAFSWRVLDGGAGPFVFRRSLAKSLHIETVITKFPPGRAFGYEIFASDRKKPSDDLASPDWEEVVPLKVGTGVVADRVDMHARHFVTRFRNLLSDPGFETAPGFWQPDPHYCTIDRKEFRSGKASAFISTVGRKPAPSQVEGPAVGGRWTNWTQTVAAEPDTEYTLSGYVKADKMEGGNANIGAHSFSSTDHKPFTNHGCVRAASERPGWQRLQMTFRTSPDEDRIRVFCDMDMNGSAWFDDVYLIEGPIPSDTAELIGQQFLKKPDWFEKWPQYVKPVTSNQ